MISKDELKLIIFFVEHAHHPSLSHPYYTVATTTLYDRALLYCITYKGIEKSVVVNCWF